MTEILDKLNRYRLARGWSIAKMATEIGVPEWRCSRNLKGTQNPHDFNAAPYNDYYAAHKAEIDAAICEPD